MAVPACLLQELRADLRGESIGDRVCQLSTEPEEVILERHTLFMTTQGLPACDISQQFPSYLSNPKLLKQPTRHEVYLQLSSEQHQGSFCVAE